MKPVIHVRSILAALLCIVLLTPADLPAQSELTPASHIVYDFLKRMQLRGVLPQYNSSVVPISRRETAASLQQIAAHTDALSSVDKDILRNLLVEFSYDGSRSDSLSYSFLDDVSFIKPFDNDRKKHLYFYTDDHASLFVDGIGSLSYRTFHGDQYDNALLLGQFAARVRGTLYNNTAYYIRLSNGQALTGTAADRAVAARFDKVLSSNTKFSVERTKNFDTYEGYLRFQTDNNWLAFTLGREHVGYGFGYMDRIFLSNNSIPFDFAKLDLQYKNVHYSYIYGNLNGDSLGRTLSSKHIVAQRLTMNFERIKIGIFESVIISEKPMSFTFMNPVGFLVSADLSTAASQTTNSFLGIDAEFIPVRDIALQGSLLIDDWNFATISNNDSTANDNKFGYQCGFQWQDAFTLSDLSLIAEFTHIGQFVYSHRSNMSTYTNSKVSLGHAVPPNSQEFAVKIGYDLSYRLGFSVAYKAQNSAGGLRFAPNGKLITNFGGSILRGEGDFYQKNVFLEGDRYDKNSTIIEVRSEPFRQFTVTVNYAMLSVKDHTVNKVYADDLMTVTAELDF